MDSFGNSKVITTVDTVQSDDLIHRVTALAFLAASAYLLSMPSSHRVLCHEEVQNLLDNRGPGQSWSYIDVRTPIEFASGHIEGAFNVPFKHGSLEGLKENPDFAATMMQAFERTQNLIVGCHSGGRAKAACAQLAALGFTALALHADSLAGSRDHFGRLSVGWLARGLPVTNSVEPGRSYAELQCQGATRAR